MPSEIRTEAEALNYLTNMYVDAQTRFDRSNLQNKFEIAAQSEEQAIEDVKNSTFMQSINISERTTKLFDIVQSAITIRHQQVQAQMPAGPAGPNLRR